MGVVKHRLRETHNMEAFVGKFERTSADKYEELLKELDVNFLLRKAATVSTPVMELKFKLGEPFDETTPDGREVTATVTFEDGKIVSVQKAKKDGQKSTRSVREMNGSDEMVYTMTVDGCDLVCVQKFKRV